MKQFKSIMVLHIFLAVYSMLGIVSKYASQKEVMSFSFLLLYGIVIGNLFLYALVWQQLLKQMSLITAYANKAITVIWGMVWGAVFFKEEFTIEKGIGAFIIIVGVYFVVSSDYEKGKEI